MTVATIIPPTLEGHTGDLALGDFRTERGGLIRDARLRYQVLGDPEVGRRTGWRLVFHALTGSSRVQDWWGPVIGPGLPLDPATGPILSANLLGSCYGSSGPAEVTDGSFPALTTADLARAHLPLIGHLGIERLSLATGGSLGGMVALQWGLLTPVPVDRLVIFAAPDRTSAQAIAWNTAQRMAIEADPAWAGGRYRPGQPPSAGLAAARAIAMITYRSVVEFDQRFGRQETRSPGRFDVDHYLRRHGEKLVERFDARSYVSLMGSMDAHDVGPAEAAGRHTARSVGEVIGVGIDTDILYYPWEVRRWVEAYARGGAKSRYEEIVTPYGHDAFLIEFGQVGRILRGNG
ncbi:MAG TPA: homoserine O-acetyltransferase [Gemmatimonadales bacterium]|nr:homoserine O-acetyltransferase [Gemmatimonadales bacterium]